MQKKRLYIKALRIIIVLLTLSSYYGCTNVKLSRLYHDFNSKFNYLINARELFSKVLSEFDESKPDNYNNPEPIKIPNNTEALSMAENLDKVIEKASFIIKKHPQSKFVEESYMLVAKSNFYKLNLSNASKIFEYVYNNFNDIKIKQEAMAYNAISKMLLGLNKESEESIDIALNITKEATDINNIIYKANAQILANNNHFLDAAKQMQLAAINTNKNDKQELLRDKLIGAFYYKKAGNNAESEAIYKDIIDNNTQPKNVVNNAKLNYLRILIADNNPISKIEELVQEEINKKENENDMLFKSQLYYLLGSLYYKNNQYSYAIKNFTESVKKAGENNLYQQAIANQAIGDIYYEHIKDFTKAITYYNAALATAVNTIPNYDVLQNRKNNLDSINKELDIIHKEDSLQNYAKLPLSEQESIADKLASKIISENEELNNTNKLQSLNNQNKIQNQAGGSNWYFYNNIALTTAQSDFKRRWGNRELTDRWRYSLKSSGNTNNIGNILTTNIDDDIIYDKDKLKDRILSQIPNTPEKLKTSTDKSINAYLNLINVSYYKLNENEQTIKYANELLKKYPDISKKDEIYYVLTEAYNNLNNTDQANLYKQKLITNFPDSKFTATVIERDKKPETIKADKQIEDAYNRAFDLFSKKQYAQLINEYYYNQSANASLDSQAKYAFLCTIALGKLENTNTFKQELINLGNLYPSTSYAKESKNLIAYIEKNYKNLATRSNVVTWSPNDNPNSVFDRLYYKEQQKLVQELEKIKNILQNSYFKKINNKDLLYIAIVVDKNLSIDSLRLNLRLFARSNFNKQYKISNKDLSDNKQIIYIGPFKNLKEANDYYSKLGKNKKFVIELDPRKYESFVITANNLMLLKSTKEIKDYLTYYRLTNWLEKTDF